MPTKAQLTKTLDGYITLVAKQAEKIKELQEKIKELQEKNQNEKKSFCVLDKLYAKDLKKIKRLEYEKYEKNELQKENERLNNIIKQMRNDKMPIIKELEDANKRLRKEKIKELEQREQNVKNYFAAMLIARLRWLEGRD